MAQLSSLAKVLNGLVQNVDISAVDLVTTSVWVGGGSGTQLTKAVLDSLISNSHASGSDNQNITAGSGLSGGGSGASVSLAVDFASVVATSVTVNGHALSSNVTVTKSDVSLGNVTNDAQLKSADLDNDTALAADSATKVPSQHAVKTYVDNHVGTASSALDGTFTINNTATPSKKLAFSAAGISASTTRTVTMPDADVDLGNLTNNNIASAAAIAESKLSLSFSTSSLNTAIGNKVAKAGDTMSGNLAMGGNKVTGLGAPSSNGDALRYDQLGANSGIATLDSGGKVPVSQLPNSVMEFQGNWDASSNTPSLADATGNIGDVYRANVAGTQDLGSGSQTFVVGDWVVYGAGGIWQKSHAGADSVLSVNGSTGTVTVNAINQLTGGDVTTSAASGSQSLAATIAAGAVSASKLGSVTDGITLDQSGSGSTLEIKSGGVGTTQLGATSVTAAKLGSDVAGTGLSGGNGSALAVASSPLVSKTMVAGESFAAQTSFLVRFAVSGETSGRVYKATDANAAADGKFWVHGIAMSAAGVSAGGNLTVVLLGSSTLGSSDTAFDSGDIGKAIWLTTAGAFSITAPTASGTATVKVGIVQDINTVFLNNVQLTGIN